MCDHSTSTAVQPTEEVECVTNARDATPATTAGSTSHVTTFYTQRGVIRTIRKPWKSSLNKNATLPNAKRVAADKPTWKSVCEHWATIDRKAPGCDRDYVFWYNNTLVPYVNKLRGKISVQNEYIHDLEEEAEDLDDKIEKAEDKKNMYKTLYNDAVECAKHCTCGPSEDDLNDLRSEE